jgi:hypothetical protein
MPVFVSACIATTFTALFAFRFQYWNRPLVVLGAFVAFFSVELAMEWLIIPPGALGVEVGLVCLLLTSLIVAATVVAHRFGGLEDD